MAENPSKAILVILDGFGLTQKPAISATANAATPFIDRLLETCPHSKLSASGNDVGLPEGQFGNSEVGHMNIGAGRVVYQELSRINRDIQNGAFFKKDALLEAVEDARDSRRIHLMGLFSSGGVHSHNKHLFALLKLLKEHGIDNIFCHAFTDGRDTQPTGGIDYVEGFEKQTDQIGAGQLSSIIGRYYAMDRDEHWKRTEAAYNLLVNGKGKHFDSAEEALNTSYENEVTDEFVEATAIGANVESSRIQQGDTIIFYNIRGDRARQITRTFTENGFDAFSVQDDLDLNYYTMTSYDDNFDNPRVVYPPPEIKNMLGEIVSNAGSKQLRIAETEKYAHVTYFLNGGREEPFEGEERIIIPSPKVATYDLQPEMSAPKIADAVCQELAKDKFKLCVLNFANPDMVGHTGDMEAAIKAVEAVDAQFKKVVETARDHEYKIMAIADHGNAECMEQADGSPHTAHTTNLVPAILIGADEEATMNDGILADVAPTLLKLMEISQPEEMTGSPLF